MTRDHLNRSMLFAAALALAGCATAPAEPGAPMQRAPATGGQSAVSPAAVVAAPAATPRAPSQLVMLETILKRVAGDQDVRISRTSTGALLLRATGDTAFNSGSSSLSPKFTDFLKQLANGLRSYSNLSMKVTGHTDNTGDAQLNNKLSQARAASTISFLVNEGVPAGRLLAEGKGQSDPIASNDSAEGRASNRRVDMMILELGG